MNEKTKKDEEFQPVTQTMLAYRIWRAEKNPLGLQSPVMSERAKRTWLGRDQSSEGIWPAGDVLEGRCNRKSGHRVPDPECTCGLYATGSLDTVNRYLGGDARVLGLVELGGRIMPGSTAHRAEYAIVAAILLIDEMFTEDHELLRDLADAYGVPALRPHSTDPEDYRADITDTQAAGDQAPGDDIDEEWRRITGGN